jgi:hypothetical protein
VGEGGSVGLIVGGGGVVASGVSVGDGVAGGGVDGRVGVGVGLAEAVAVGVSSGSGVSSSPSPQAAAVANMAITARTPRKRQEKKRLLVTQRPFNAPTPLIAVLNH